MSEIPEDILSSLQELLSRAAQVPNPQHLTDPAWREFPLHPRGDGPWAATGLQSQTGFINISKCKLTHYLKDVEEN